MHSEGFEPPTLGSEGRSTRPPKSVVSPKPFASLQRIASSLAALHTLHILAAFTAFSSKFSDRTLTRGHNSIGGCRHRTFIRFDSERTDTHFC